MQSGEKISLILIIVIITRWHGLCFCIKSKNKPCSDPTNFHTIPYYPVCGAQQQQQQHKQHYHPICSGQHKDRRR